MKFWIVLAVAALVITATVPLAADSCTTTQICNPDTNFCTDVETCTAEYYVWQYWNAPNWCLYQANSEVAIQFNAQFQPTAWYVTPPSDPGRDGDYVVVKNGSNCGIIPYPW